MAKVACPDCGGEGMIETACVKTYICWRCNGHGEIEISDEGYGEAEPVAEHP